MTTTDDLVERLTKACKVADACPECLLDREQAAARIREQEAEIARLNRAAELYTEAGSAATLQWEQRAERAEAERDAAVFRGQMLLEAKNEWADRARAAAAEIERLRRAESDALMVLAAARDVAHEQMIRADSISEANNMLLDRAKRAEASEAALREILAEHETLWREQDAAQAGVIEAAKDIRNSPVSYDAGRYAERQVSHADVEAFDAALDALNARPASADD